jgi:hypothetical protein
MKRPGYFVDEDKSCLRIVTCRHQELTLAIPNDGSLGGLNHECIVGNSAIPF